MLARLTRRMLPFVIWACSAQAMAVETTTPKSVGVVIVSEGVIYVTANPDGWGTTCSPAPSYVYFNRTAPNGREMLAAILAAKAAGQHIYFVGNCSSPGYFLSTYLVIL